MPGMEVYIQVQENGPGLDVYIAQLESMAKGKDKGGMDQKQAFELLQGLAACIERTEKAALKGMQRKCEDVVVDILLHGCCPSVRRLVCSLLCKMYKIGDTLPMYSRVGMLQSHLVSRGVLSGRDAGELGRCGALECLAMLCSTHGLTLSNTMEQSVTAAIKNASAKEVSVRSAALRLLAAAVNGAKGTRGSDAMQTEAIKAVKTYMKDKSAEVRAGAAAVLSAVAAAGGAGYWSAGSQAVEDIIRAVVAMLDDAGDGVAPAFAEALGLLAASVKSPAAKAALEARKGPKRSMLERTMQGTFNACLVIPLCENTVLGRTKALGELAGAWLAYIGAVRSGEFDDFDEVALVDIAVMGIAKLANARIAEESLLASGALLPKPSLGWGISSGEQPALQACMIYIVRAGVIEHLSSAGLLELLEKLCAVLGSQLGTQTPVAVVALEAIGLVLEALGEVTTEVHLKVEEPVRWKLLAGSSVVRMQAARLLAALAAAQPPSAAEQLRTAIEDLRQAAAQMASLAAPYGAKYSAFVQSGPPPSAQHAPGIPEAPGTPRGPGTRDIRPAVDAAHGRALSLAALLVAAKKLPLGVPHSLPLQALALADSLITSPSSTVPTAKAVEREAGYVLLGALCYSLPEEAIRGNEERLLNLWSEALESKSVMLLDERHFTGPKGAGEEAWAQELWWRAAALQALVGFIVGPMATAAPELRARLTKAVCRFLHPALTAIAACLSLNDVTKNPASTLTSSAATFRLRLLQAYCCIPDAHAYIRDHKTLVTTCARPLSGTTKLRGDGHLRRLLNDKGGALLGPWLSRRNALEDELASFSGAAGGPLIHPWEAGMGFNIDSGSDGRIETLIGSTGASVLLYAFPQAVSLEMALLETELVVVGRLVSVAVPAQQLAVLGMMTGAVRGEVGRRKERDYARREAMAFNVCAASIEGLTRAADKAHQTRSDGSDQIADAAAELALQVVAESDGDPALIRAAADIMGTAAALGTDAYAVKLLQTLCKQVPESKTSEECRFSMLAISRIHALKGGMVLRSMVPGSVDVLIGAARSLDPVHHAWALHALQSVADSSGLAFIKHVQQCLDLLRELLALPVPVLPGLLPFTGRVVNSMVVVLGPELNPKSSTFRTCLSLLLEMDEAAGEVGLHGGLSSCWQQSIAGRMPPSEAVAALLETVHWAQQAVLFAGHAVPTSAHLPLLRSKITSEQPTLREAAARCLRHLAERDSGALLPTGVQRDLFTAIDSESDEKTLQQLQAALCALLAEGGRENPVQWMQLFASVALISGNTAAGHATEHHESVADTSMGALVDEDDSDGEGAGGGSPAPGGASSGAAPPGGSSSSPDDASLGGKAVPRLRTRMFACSLLMDLLDMLASEPLHFDSSVLQGQKQAKAGPRRGQWLIQHLQTLVDLGYKLASGEVEVLRDRGMEILIDIVKRFGSAPDPDFEGHKLLELYQAQLVSAIRMALLADAAPVTNGCHLAAVFLENGLDGGDPVVVRRLMALLTQPLKVWEKMQGKGSADERYAEWVGVRMRVAVLAAHAQCATHAAGQPGESETAAAVRDAQAPLAEQLSTLWLELLQDHAVLARSRQSPEMLGSYSPLLFGSTSPPVVGAVRPYLEAAWPTVLAGVAAGLSGISDVKGGGGGGGGNNNNKGDGGESAPAPTRADRLLWASFFGLQQATGELIVDPSASEQPAEAAGATSTPGSASGSRHGHCGAPDEAADALKPCLECLQRATQLQADAGELLWSGKQLSSIVRVLKHVADGPLTGLLSRALRGSSEHHGDEHSNKAPGSAGGALGILPWALSCCADTVAHLIRLLPVLPDASEKSLIAEGSVELALSLACLCVPIEEQDGVREGPETVLAAGLLPPGTADGEKALLASGFESCLGAMEAALKEASRCGGEGGDNDKASTGGPLRLLVGNLEALFRLLRVLPPGPQQDACRRSLVACVAWGSGQGAEAVSAASAAAASLLEASREAAAAAEEGVPDSGALLRAAVEAAGSLVVPSKEEDEPLESAAAQVQRDALAALRAALAADSPEPLQAAAVKCLQQSLQSGGEAEPGSPGSLWAVSCLLHGGGLAVAKVLEKLEGPPEVSVASDDADEDEGDDWGFQGATTASTVSPFSDEDLQFAAATLRSVMLALRVVEGIPAELSNKAHQGGDGDLCGVVMGLLAPLLLACAAPSNAACASPALSSMAVQLITHLAKGAGRATDTFKAHVAALSVGDKQRLQAALQASSAAAAGRQAVSAAAQQPGGRAAAHPAAQAPAAKIQFNLSKFKA